MKESASKTERSGLLVVLLLEERKRRVQFLRLAVCRCFGLFPELVHPIWMVFLHQCPKRAPDFCEACAWGNIQNPRVVDCVLVSCLLLSVGLTVRLRAVVRT